MDPHLRRTHVIIGNMKIVQPNQKKGQGTQQNKRKLNHSCQLPIVPLNIENQENKYTELQHNRYKRIMGTFPKG